MLEFYGALTLRQWKDALWGQVLHGSARTTAAVRRAIQRSQESLRTLAKRHGVNSRTIAKWRNYYETHDHLRERLANFVAAYNCAKRLDPEGPHSLRIRLQMPDKGTQAVHIKSAPSNSSTKHLTSSTSGLLPV